MTTSIFIDGAVGTTGLQIRERLSGRTGIDLITLAESARKSETVRRDALNAADIVILCLPDDAARAAVTLIANPHTRIIDASTAHRVTPGWTYGFPELQHGIRDRIARSMRVTNPGCYSTGFLALVAPLVERGLIPPNWPITVNAVSGYSGGGKAMIAEFEAGDAVLAWRTYGLALAHKHIPEMQLYAGLARAPLFAPSVAHTYCGMIVEVPLILDAMPMQPSATALRDVLRAHYASAPMINVRDNLAASDLSLDHAAHTDRIDLFVFDNEQGTQARLVAALDNLGKGAAGACVQSLNLMIGCQETEGLQL